METNEVKHLTYDNPEALNPTEGWQGVIWEVRCPVCNDIAIDRMIRGEGGDETAVTVHPDLDDYTSPIGTRGGHIRVELYCSRGHHFALIIANHKGAEVIGLVASE